MAMDNGRIETFFTDSKGKFLVTRALRHRNYRIYFFGLFVSFTGTWMQSVAQG